MPGTQITRSNIDVPATRGQLVVDLEAGLPGDDDTKKILRAREAKMYDFLQQLEPEIQRALPQGQHADRLTRIAYTEIRRSVMFAAQRGGSTQSLLDVSPASFAGAILMGAALGLEFGVLGEAYLVPKGGECVAIWGYHGYKKLYWQHPLAQNLIASYVCEKDPVWEYEEGDHPFVKHRRAWGPRGEIIAYYAIAVLRTGAVIPKALDPEQTKRLRRGKVGPQGDIPDPEHWMEVKEPMRQVLGHQAPRSTLLVYALSSDEQSGLDLMRDGLPELARKEPRRLEGGLPTDVPESAPEPEQQPKQPAPQRDTVTAQKPSKARTALIAALTERHGVAGAEIAVRVANDNVYLTMDTATEAHLRAALEVPQERIADILQDQQLAQEPPTPPEQ